MHVVVVGCGRMGTYLAQALVTSGHEVCVIDDNPASFDRLDHDFPGRTLVGTGFDEDVLRDAGVTETGAAVLAVTNVDATNFMVAQVARSLFGVQAVGVRINDPELGSLVAECGFSPINLPVLTAEHVAAMLAAPEPDAGSAAPPEAGAGDGPPAPPPGSGPSWGRF